MARALGSHVVVGQAAQLGVHRWDKVGGTL
jgi:hypothetical protein